MIERKVELRGRGTTFVREVTGPPHAPVLILLHGLAATGLLNWGLSLPALGRAFRAVAIDHRGHGRGIRTRLPFRLEACADDVVALADVLEVEKFVAVGYSMGGPIAQLLWRRHPERIAGLVLCATASRFADPRQRQAAAVLGPILSMAARAAPVPLWQQAARRMLDEGVKDPQLRELLRRETSETQPSALVEAGAALARFDSSSWLGKVDVPAAVVVTTRDELIQPGRQLELAALIPGTEVFRVDADHYACVARPDLFVPALYGACRRVAMLGPSIVSA